MRSLQGISGALHLGIFQHPARTYFFSNQLGKSGVGYGSVAGGRLTGVSGNLRKSCASAILLDEYFHSREPDFTPLLLHLVILRFGSFLRTRVKPK